MPRTSTRQPAPVPNPPPAQDPWGKWAFVATIVMSLITIGTLYGAFTARIAVLETKLDNLSAIPGKIDTLNEKIHQTQMGLVQIAAKQGITLSFDGVDIQSQQPDNKGRKPQN